MLFFPPPFNPLFWCGNFLLSFPWYILICKKKKKINNMLFYCNFIISKISVLNLPKMGKPGLKNNFLDTAKLIVLRCWVAYVFSSFELSERTFCISFSTCNEIFKYNNFYKLLIN